jgi:hypothetical protein
MTAPVNPAINVTAPFNAAITMTASINRDCAGGGGDPAAATVATPQLP